MPLAGDPQNGKTEQIVFEAFSGCLLLSVSGGRRNNKNGLKVINSRGGKGGGGGNARRGQVALKGNTANKTVTKSPPKKGRISDLYNLIFPFLHFDNTNQRVSFRQTDLALNKILSARDQLSKWIVACENNDKLNVVRVHFESLESMLSALIEDHKGSVDPVLYSLYCK